jgi:hypothetical protein
MNERNLAGFLDELTKIGAAPGLGAALGEAAGQLYQHGKGLAGSATQGAGHLWKAVRSGSEAAAKHLESTGSRLGRAGAAASRIAPYAGVAYVGDKALTSQPVQAIRSRLSGQPQTYQGGY